MKRGVPCVCLPGLTDSPIETLLDAQTGLLVVQQVYNFDSRCTPPSRANVAPFTKALMVPRVSETSDKFLWKEKKKRENKRGGGGHET